MAQQFGLQRAVDHLGHPQVLAEELGIEGHAGVLGHPGGRGVDEPTGAPALDRQPVADPHRGRRRSAAPGTHEALRLIGFPVADHEASHTERQGGVGNGRTCAARSEEHHVAQLDARQAPPETPLEPRPVGVVTDRPPGGEHDGVDRAQLGGVVGEVVEVLEHAPACMGG